VKRLWVKKIREVIQETYLNSAFRLPRSPSKAEPTSTSTFPEDSPDEETNSQTTEQVRQSNRNTHLSISLQHFLSLLSRLTLFLPQKKESPSQRELLGHWEFSWEIEFWRMRIKESPPINLSFLSTFALFLSPYIIAGEARGQKERSPFHISSSVNFQPRNTTHGTAHGRPFSVPVSSSHSLFPKSITRKQA